jgi:putative CocE/NonD family hydrolase
MLSVAAPTTVSMRTSDECRLDATVWRPEAPGRYPVLLMRQPYGRAIASTLVFAHPAWYAAHGYIVAVQDVRGTGTSEGEFRLFLDEEADGAQAVAWAAALDGSTGAVGTYGFSYQANTQYLALAGGAVAGGALSGGALSGGAVAGGVLAGGAVAGGAIGGGATSGGLTGGGAIGAMAPAMGAWDVRTDWAWENNAFRLGPNLGWGLQMGFVKAVHDGDRVAAHSMRAAAQSLPLAEPHRTRPDVIRRFGHWTHYEAWLTHPDPGPFWQSFAPAARLANHPLDVPMLHVGGWYDQMLMGTLAGHDAVTAAAKAEQALHIGPWTHQPWGRRAGGVDFGPAAMSPIDKAQVNWFDRHLKGRDIEPLGGLHLFDVGSRMWRRFSAWPDIRPLALFLGGDGRAAAASSGTLATSAGSVGTDRIVHDPWRPAPVMGGHGSAPAGMQDRAALDDRADVAIYDFPPLDRPLFLCGRVAATLALEADQPSFDIDVVLSMLTPDGQAWTLTQGHARIDAADGAREIPMRAVCVSVPAAHGLRLSIAAAAAPSYAVNPGTGAAAADFTAADERIITIAIRHRDSRLLLPEVV